MFSLHEATKVTLCRALFLALAVLPTCGVFVYALATRLPTYRRAHERAIAVQLGWQATLSRASSPRPGVMLYEGLALADPETGQLLASLPLVEVSRSGAILTIRMAFPATINGARLDAFWQLAAQELSRAGPERVARVEAGNLILHLRQGDLSLADARAEFSAGDARELEVEFRSPGDPPQAEPARLSIARQRQASPPATVVHVVSGVAPLPCALLAGVFPQARAFGEASTFAGEIRATTSAAGWSASIRGAFDGVDLDRFFRGRFGHHLAGGGRLQLDKALVHDGRLESARGMLTAGPGQISRTLLAAAQAHLGMSAPRSATEGSGVVAYRQLCVQFALDAEGLWLSGGADNPSAVVVDTQGKLIARQDVFGPQPPLNLLRALVPDSEYQVPAAKETDWLSRLMPLPSIERATRDEAVLKANSLQLKTRD